MHTPDKLLVIGAIPRGGNHLLRGLLDSHPALLLPPDEDYFVRQLLRSRIARWHGQLCSPSAAPAFYRRVQKHGHLERVNAGATRNSFDTQGSLNLDRYYQLIRSRHRRFSLNTLIENHFLGLESALQSSPVTADTALNQIRTLFCALHPERGDLCHIRGTLAEIYQLQAIFVLRDPRSHYASELGRKGKVSLSGFCRKQNLYLDRIEAFENGHGPVLRVRFESLIMDTQAAMRRVCEFAGIDFLPITTQFTQNGKPTFSNSSHSSVPGIDTRAICRYRDTLSAGAIERIERDCRPELFWHPQSAPADQVPNAA